LKIFLILKEIPRKTSQLYNLTKNTNPWLRPRKNEPKKKGISFFFLKKLTSRFLKPTNPRYPQFVPKSNRDQPKKISPKRIISPSSLFLLQKTEETRACISQGGGGGLGETPGGVVEVVVY
jgi:hypothetical protein